MIASRTEPRILLVLHCGGNAAGFGCKRYLTVPIERVSANSQRFRAELAPEGWILDCCRLDDTVTYQAFCPRCSARLDVPGAAVLDMPIEDLELSTRAVVRIKFLGAKTLRELLALSQLDLLRVPGFGRKTLREVCEVLDGLGFGLSLAPRQKTERST